MSEAKKQLKGEALADFLKTLGIVRLDPVGASSASGELLSDEALTELLRKGDPVPPGPGRVPESSRTLAELFGKHGPAACFALTPDGHLDSHHPVAFDAARAAEQVAALMEPDIKADDREEALAATWLGLAYHNHDHPADFGGLLLGADGQPRCCYLDVKRTEALAADRQRTKLEQRAQERKLGLMALTVTTVRNNGFAGYPGRGRPGLLAMLLFNPVSQNRPQSGFAVNWFFGIASNYQATAAKWGWGGPRGFRLPDALTQQLRARQSTIGGETTTWLALLEAFGHYGQYRDDSGTWDRERLRETLQAMAFSARYLLMNEDVIDQAQSSVANLQPGGVKRPLRLEEFHPGESLASYYGRQTDEADRLLAEARSELTRTRDQFAEQQHQSVVRLRKRGLKDAEIAEDLGYSLDDFLRLFPPQS